MIKTLAEAFLSAPPEHSALLVDLHICLVNAFEGNHRALQQWLHTPHKELKIAPIEHIKNGPAGMRYVMAYIDYRGVYV